MMTTEPNNGCLVSLVDADAAPVALERTWPACANTGRWWPEHGGHDTRRSWMT